MQPMTVTETGRLFMVSALDPAPSISRALLTLKVKDLLIARPLHCRS